MSATPHVITVDPTGSLGRIVRAVSDLLDQNMILTEMASGEDALAAVEQRPCAILVTTVELEDDMRGYQLAIEVSRVAPQTQIIILAESSDPELDADELADNSPYVYLHRPVQLGMFARIMTAAFAGEDMFAAMAAPRPQPNGTATLGEVPYVDAEAARPIVDALLTDVGAMAIIFASRTGNVLLERGAVGYLDREKLTSALQPMFGTTIYMGDLVGGQTRTLHFYDGDEYDVFVISVGLHHFMCLVFNGEAGNRAFGSVNRFGRRAAEDLVAMMGASAFAFEQPKKPVTGPLRRRRARQPEEEPEEIFQPLERTEITPEEPKPLQLDPIEELDLSIFDNLDNLDLSNADDLFDPDKLADLANESNSKSGTTDLDQAIELGILGELD